MILLGAILSEQITIQAATISLRPVADTTLQEAFPNDNLGDGTSFTAGGRRKGGRTRALMLFDIAGNLPAGARVDSVTLTLSVIGAPGGGVNSTFDLARVQSLWGEGNGSDRGGGSPGSAGQATWINRLGPGSVWNTAGGDYSSTASASHAIAGFGVYTFSSDGIVEDVQSWLSAPANNFGWLLRSESELSSTSIRRFGSRNDLANSPVLTISYLIPEPGTIPLLSLGLATTAWRRWRGKRRIPLSPSLSC